MSDTAYPEVDFLIIGAAKSATTWLQHALTDTALAWLPAPELHYFSRHYDRGPGWYAAQFEGRATDRAVGEKSNSYLTEPRAAERIRRHLPNVRMIVQMRHPVARAYSHYCMLYRRGEVSDDITRYLDPDRAADGLFLDHGRYAHHLARFHALFGADAILPLVYEEVVADPARHLERVSSHLGLPSPGSLPRTGHVKDRDAAVVPRPLRRLLRPARPLLDPLRHTGPVRALRDAVARPVRYPALTGELARDILAFYRDDMRELARMTACDPQVWRVASAAYEAASIPPGRRPLRDHADAS